MPFSVSWHTLLDECDDLPDDAIILTPLSHNELRITDTQEHRVIADYVDKDETRPLQREQFETLYRRITDAPDQEFALDRLPPDAAPYAAVWSLHPRFEIDEDAGVIRESDAATETQVISDDTEDSPTERQKPDLLLY